jgi:SAM-dependent methyltransferase
VSNTPPWKSRFYAAYVSSGQAGDSGAEAEVLFQPRKAFLRHIIAQHIPRDTNARILELACGPGALLYFLERAGYRNIAGVDVSEEQIAVAARLGILSATCSPFEDFLSAQAAASADRVLAIDILEHLSREEIVESLGAIRRVLKRGGRCVAHVPNGEGLFGMRIRYGDFTHEMALTPKSAQQVFRMAGFRDVRCFEERPRVHGPTSLARRILWDVGTLPSRILLAAETGDTRAVLSQNMMIEAVL